MSEWAILGVHVERNDLGAVLSRNLRVRMIVNDQIIDEDFPYGPLARGVPENEDVLSGLMKAEIDARVSELVRGARVKEGSLIVDKQKTPDKSVEERLTALEARVNRLDPSNAIDAEILPRSKRR